MALLPSESLITPSFPVLSLHRMGGHFPSPLLKEVARKHQPCSLLLMSITGSHLYGFSSADSDIDLRGVYALAPSQILGLEQGPERIAQMSGDATRDDLIDMVTYEVRKVASLLLSRNGNILEMIFSPLVAASDHQWHQELQILASRSVTRYHEKHYRGFAAGEWNALMKKGEREKRGIKHLLYLYRTLLTGIFLMQTGVVESHLPSLLEMTPIHQVEELLARKVAGEEEMGLTEEEVLQHKAPYHHLLDKLEEASQKSALPPTVSADTKRFLHQFVWRAHVAAGVTRIE